VADYRPASSQYFLNSLNRVQTAAAFAATAAKKMGIAPGTLVNRAQIAARDTTDAAIVAADAVAMNLRSGSMPFISAEKQHRQERAQRHLGANRVFTRLGIAYSNHLFGNHGSLNSIVE
jgi:hypothetical protein